MPHITATATQKAAIAELAHTERTTITDLVRTTITRIAEGELAHHVEKAELMTTELWFDIDPATYKKAMDAAEKLGTPLSVLVREHLSARAGL